MSDTGQLASLQKALLKAAPGRSNVPYVTSHSAFPGGDK